MKQFVKAKRSVNQNVCPNRKNVRNNRMEREISQESSLPWETLKLRESLWPRSRHVGARQEETPSWGGTERWEEESEYASKSISVLKRMSRHFKGGMPQRSWTEPRAPQGLAWPHSPVCGEFAREFARGFLYAKLERAGFFLGFDYHGFFQLVVYEWWYSMPWGKVFTKVGSESQESQLGQMDRWSSFRCF